MARELTKTEKGVLGFFGGLFAFLGIRQLVKGKEEKPPPPPPDMATLYAKVSNAQTGKAVEGIEVGFSGYAGVTNANGHCIIENIIPGNYEIIFHDPLGRYEPLVL